jgi:very-short-patch-repair endonuclease
VDLAHLRATLRPHIISLSGRTTHRTIPETCENLGMLAPEEGSKQDRVTAAFDTLADSDLVHTAARYLQLYQPSASKRNELQDILWSDLPTPEIPKRIRREIARALNDEELYLDSRRFDDLLDRLWILDDGSAGLMEALLLGRPYQDQSLGARIQQHVHKNPGDWSAEELFDVLGAFEASDNRFALFLEGLASSDVRPEASSQRRFVEIVNEPLRRCGVEMRETDSKDGYPVFTLVQIHGSPVGRPKNLIFASQSKPDLRFRDAINNDVEIVTNANKVLIYDRPITTDGIRWSDLQMWWAETKAISDKEEAKRTLYRRLLASLPEDSPPQRILFESYFKRFRSAIPGLPALLPEVWLHWDPKTVRERGPEALLRFRMDFLLLLPGGVRVVLEVDGKHHYADDEGRAAPSRYANMVKADRDLKLAGYHVFRFGAAELVGESATAVAQSFFEVLFKQFRIAIPGR